MIAIPRIRADEGAVAKARRYESDGFRYLLIDDIGADVNGNIVGDIATTTDVSIWVITTIRDVYQTEALLQTGISQIVMGIRSIQDLTWVEATATMFPYTLIVAADVRAGRLASREWARPSDHPILDLISDLNAMPLSGFMPTTIHNRSDTGRSDLELLEDIVGESFHPVCANDYPATLHDLLALERSGASFGVVSSALDTGALNPCVIAEEFTY